MSHATCTEMCVISLVFHFIEHMTEESALPGPGFVVLLRVLCGPGLSTKFQGNPAKQGSQTCGSFPFSEKYVWAHKNVLYAKLFRD